MSEGPTIIDNVAEHRFEARLGQDVAFAEYRMEAGRMELPHTVVPDAFAGKGVASALARHAFDHARARSLTVIPTCSFMAGWVKKHPEFHDIVDPSSRAELGIA